MRYPENWLKWKVIGIYPSTMMLIIILASAPNDPRRRFCTSIPIKKRHHRRADAEQKHALLRRGIITGK